MGFRKSSVEGVEGLVFNSCKNSLIGGIRMEIKDLQKELEEHFKKLEALPSCQKEEKVRFKNFGIFISSEKVISENEVKKEVGNILTILKNNNFILYGAGMGGATFVCDICNFLKKYPLAVIDRKFKKEENFFDIPAFNLETFLKKFPEKRNNYVIIAIGKKEFQKEVLNNLVKQGFQKEKIIIPSHGFWAYFTLWINYYLNKSLNFYLRNKEKIFQAFKVFIDEISKELFLNLIKIYTTGEIVSLSRFCSSLQYLPEDIKLSKGGKRIIHGGAFTGDTIRIFVQKLGKIEKLVCFEPDMKNFAYLTKYLKKEKEKIADEIIAFPCGLWNKTTQLKFKSGGPGGTISSEGEHLVPVVAIDDVLPEFPATYITMDIEGAEIEALEGAKMLIKKHKPDLAICVYHKPEHLWEIPLYLKSLVPEYKFFLRNYTGGIVETILYATC